MVDQFAELGVQRKKLYQVITRSPQLLLQKPEDFLQVFFFCSNQVYMIYDRDVLQVFITIWAEEKMQESNIK
jgi:hypothetical protein